MLSSLGAALEDEDERKCKAGEGTEWKQIDTEVKGNLFFQQRMLPIQIPADYLRV